MKLSQYKTKIWGLFLALFVVLGVTAVSGNTAQAQWRRDRDRDWERRDRDDNRDWDRRDRDDREWSRRNRDDRWDRRDRDDRNWDRYRRNRNYGGYGYGGYDIYQVALNDGYQAGLYTGSSDAQRGQSYNPQRSHYYRNGYGDNSRYRGAGQYKQAFRQGFLRGYQEGYQQYGGYHRRRNNGQWFPW